MAAILSAAKEEVTAFTAFPASHPNEAAVLRLAGAVLLEVHDEWAIAERRYLTEGSMALPDRVTDGGSTKEVDGAKSLLLAS